MSTRLDQSRLDTMPSGIRTGTALADDSLAALGRTYKKDVASRYRLLKESQMRELSPEGLYASIKLDGQLHFLYKDDNEIFLWNPRGRVITNLPLLAEARNTLPAGRIILAGELYSTLRERSRVYDVTSALGQSSDGDVSKLAFGAFDILELDSERWTGHSFKETNDKLAELLPATSGPIHHVEHHEVDLQKLTKMFNDQVVEGANEGLVCLSDQAHIAYKVKQRHDVDAVIVGFTERPDEPGSVRVLLTALMRPDGSFQVMSKVGGGIEDDLRRELYRMLRPLAVESQYKETDRNHTLFTMVRPKFVVEVGFHDVITEDSSGKPQMKPVLTFDEAEGYHVQVPEKFASIIFPTFRRLREDKEVNPDDLRLTQLRDFVDLDNLGEPSRNMDLAKSEILQRDVYVKVTKGLTAVRKFMSWKTNKHEIDDSFPAYAFCYVDYSPGRAAPLKRNIRIARTEEKIREIHQSYLDNEVKRGWKPPE